MSTTVLVVVALLALAPCAFAAETAPAAPQEALAFCPAASPEAPATPWFLAGAPGKSKSWCPWDICQMNCESFCGAGLGRCTPGCYCECW